jgi:sugar/nucleoside kinase (ribokinase family)
MALPPVDYLILGHLTKDMHPNNFSLGGTVAYSGLTAAAFGVRVGAVTSMGPDMQLSRLGEVTIHRLQAPATTTFINDYSAEGRTQRITGRALPLDLEAVPAEWRSPRWVHLGPVADEVDVRLAAEFPNSFVGLTPQGWFRRWDENGLVSATSWEVARGAIVRAQAVVISLEDVGGDEAAVKAMADCCPVLVLTDGAHGARLYTEGTMRVVPAVTVRQVDPTGAGDIFAAAFFVRLQQTGNALHAARLANQVAAASVAREGLAGVPSAREVQAALSTKPL